MATISAGNTLLEMAKSISPSGTQMKIAQVMVKKMSMLFDIPWFQSNDIWSHKSLREASTPSPTWRGVDEHVSGNVGLTQEINDIIGIVEDFATYPKLWIDRQPDPPMARTGRAKMHIRGMAESIISAFLYGNSNVTPKKPHGIAPRLASTGRYVISNGGSSNLTSAYIVGWGEGRSYGVFPKHGSTPESEFLVQQRDLGERVDVNSSGNKLIVYEDNFKFEGGLVIEDPRTIGRLCNIESSGVSNTFDEDNLITLIDRMDIDETTVIYVNESILTQMRIKMKDKANVNFTPGKGSGLFGEPVLYFDTIPIRKIDSTFLLNSESQVS